MMKKLLIFFAAVALVSCTLNKENTSTTDNSPKGIEKIILVNHQKVSCTGSGTLTCLQIKELLDGAAPEKWSYLYTQIEGFDYETGYLYKLKIRETKIKRKNVPADGSTTKRTLIEVIEKKAISVPQLNGTWTAELIKGTDEKLVAQYSPNITLDNGTLRGSDGCNALNFSYKNDQKNIAFNFIGKTKRGCQGDANIIAEAFTTQFKIATSYLIIDNNLTLFDAKGDFLIYFSKN